MPRSESPHEELNRATAQLLRRMADLVETHQFHTVDFSRHVDYAWLLTNRHADDEPAREKLVVTLTTLREGAR